MGQGDAGGFGGRELSPDDPLSPSSEPWEGGKAPVESGDHERPAYDPMMGSGRVLGDAFDGLVDAGPLPELDLEAVAPPRPSDLPLPPSMPPAASASVQRSFRPPAASSPSLPPSDGTPADDLSPAEVAATADYGDDPASFVMWVPYAILVLSRRMALKKALADLRRLEQSAANDEEESLIELGRGLHAFGEDEAMAPLASLVREANETGKVAAGRTEEWEKSRQAANAQRSSLQSKIEEAQKALGPFRDRETKLATQMDTREQNLRRAKAQLSRVDIEIRNLSSAESIDAPKLELLTAQQQARSAEVATAQGHVDELEPQLASARKELTVMLGAINDLEKQRRRVDDAQNRTEKVHLSTAGEAEKRYHETVVKIADEALKRNIAQALEPSLARSATMMKRALDARKHEIRVHEAALGDYDKGAFQKGWAIIAVAGLIVLTMIVLMIVR